MINQWLTSPSDSKQALFGQNTNKISHTIRVRKCLLLQFVQGDLKQPHVDCASFYTVIFLFLHKQLTKLNPSCSDQRSTVLFCGWGVVRCTATSCSLLDRSSTHFLGLWSTPVPSHPVLFPCIIFLNLKELQKPELCDLAVGTVWPPLRQAGGWEALFSYALLNDAETSDWCEQLPAVRPPEAGSS